MLVLGVSGGFGHDASACIIKDGRLVAFAEEERLTRNKIASGVPAVRSILECVAESGARLRDIDVLATSWLPQGDASTPVLHNSWSNLLRSPELASMRVDRVLHFDHHTSHTATVGFMLGLPNAECVVMDGRGENSSSSLFSGTGPGLKPRATLDVVDSIGSFYSAAARFAGFSRGGEGKLMGLAAYASPAEWTEPPFKLDSAGPRAQIDVPRIGLPGERHQHVRSAWFNFFDRKFGAMRQRMMADTAEGRKTDYLKIAGFAAAVQECTETAIMHLLSIWAPPMGHFLVTGGVALNCAANGAVRRQFGDRVHFYAASGDSGTSIGAAVLGAVVVGDELQLENGSPYIGRAFSDEEVAKSLSSLHLSATEVADAAELASKLITKGHIVGWFQGAAEAGPRALGHRSILGLAQDKTTNSRINSLKQREPWRPFAPSILPEATAGWFERPDSPYMLEARRATSAAASEVPAVVHVDNTSRIHTLSAAVSPRFHALLRHLGNETGAQLVLNTSFNVGPEPIVYSPSDAVRTFYGSGLDDLIIGNSWLTKPSHR